MGVEVGLVETSEEGPKLGRAIIILKAMIEPGEDLVEGVEFGELDL
jgi:hypothetical protein